MANRRTRCSPHTRRLTRGAWSLTFPNAALECTVDAFGMSGSATPKDLQPQPQHPRGMRCQWEGCEMHCATAEELFEHLSAHASHEPWECRWSECRNPANVGRHWPYRSTLLQHLPFECPHCDFRTTFQWRLASHVRKHDAAVQSSQRKYVMPSGDGSGGSSGSSGSKRARENVGDSSESSLEAQQRLLLLSSEGEPQAKARRAASARLAQVVVLDGTGRQCGDARQVVVTAEDTVGSAVAAIEREVLPVGRSVERVWRCTPDGARVLIDARQYGYAFDLMIGECAVAVECSASAEPAQQQTESAEVLLPVDQCAFPEMAQHSVASPLQLGQCPSPFDVGAVLGMPR
eukprot:m51a1_g10199 hypothetical protein (347) ;mRNA; f:43103-44697